MKRPVFDDDAVIVPPPHPEMFARTSAPERRVPFFARLGVRRTLIPILLTLGGSLIALGTLWFRLDPDSPLRDLGSTPAIAFLVLGPVLLLLAVLNMAQVAKQMAAGRRDLRRV
ncbi:MAG: hypothetical protein ACREJC_13510 [Tepidisphaeraceae bacterium]